jgi:ribosomal-protein-alanine N-acetyltransferase
MFFNKSTHEFIGRCGIRNMEFDGNMELEMGYNVMPQFWKNAYATEMGTKILDIAFHPLNKESVVAFTQKTNLASEKTMQKLGFKFEKDIIWASLEHVLYRIKKK